MRKKTNRWLTFVVVVLILTAGAMAGINTGGNEAEQMEMSLGISLFLMTVFAVMKG